jgi:hypothetical protein
MHKSLGLISIALLALSINGHAQVPLSEESFHDLNATKGLVILQVNWGRYWKCGQYEDAQLQKLAFRRLGTEAAATPDKDWVLAPVSTLLTKPNFEPYLVYLDPGRYALSSFRFKVAASVTDVRVAEPGPSDLIVGDNPIGGSFTVAAGETVYIGHFGVDCGGEPAPWRFYIDGAKDFARYVDGFHKKYPFTKDTPVIFRLFQTDKFGQAYDLPK